MAHERALTAITWRCWSACSLVAACSGGGALLPPMTRRPPPGSPRRDAAAPTACGRATWSRRSEVHGQRLQRRHPQRPRRPDHGPARRRAASSRGDVGNAPAGHRSVQLASGCWTDSRTTPRRGWSRASSGRAPSSRRPSRTSGRASTWSSATASRAGQGAARQSSRRRRAAPAAEPTARRLRDAAEPARGSVEPVGQPAAARETARSRSSVCSSSLPRASRPAGRRRAAGRCAVGDHRTARRARPAPPTRPAGSRSSPTSTPCIRERRADRDLEQVGGDPLQRRGLDVEVARGSAAAVDAEPLAPPTAASGRSPACR